MWGNMSVLMTTSVSNTVFEERAEEVYNSKGTNIKFEQIKENCPNLAINNKSAIPCPDQYVAMIKVTKGKIVEFCPCFDFTIPENRSSNSEILKNMSDVPVIAVVLESPHKDEFKEDSAIGPAVGETGDNFRLFFEEMLESAIANRQLNLIHMKYRILFINPIQYQCSLGDATKNYRDDIFTEMWNYQDSNKQNIVQNDFMGRLQSHSPAIVINCCTKGNFKDNEEDKHLRKLVQEAIDKKFSKSLKSTQLLKSTHPCCWNDYKNRFIIKV